MIILRLPFPEHNDHPKAKKAVKEAESKADTKAYDKDNYGADALQRKEARLEQKKQEHELSLLLQPPTAIQP